MHMHMHPIEEDTNLKQMTGPIVLDKSSPAHLRSGPKSWNWHGDIFYAFALSELEGGYTNGIHGSGFSIACNFWVFGEAIQWTTDYPQGHNAEGNGWRNGYLH